MNLATNPNITIHIIEKAKSLGASLAGTTSVVR